MSYTELQVTTNFSFLRGGSHPEEMVAQAIELGYKQIAIKDRNTLAGIVRAHVAARHHGMGALGDLPGHQVLERLFIHASIMEGGDEGGDRSLEHDGHPETDLRKRATLTRIYRTVTGATEPNSLVLPVRVAAVRRKDGWPFGRFGLKACPLGL